MTNREIIEQYTPLWGSWFVDSEIGSGNYGSVFKIFKEDFKRYEAAVKLIQIPRVKSEINDISSYGIDETGIDGFLEDTLKRMTKEIELMYALKGNSNIVSYEEHIIEKKINEPGYNILIKMELLETLSQYLKKNPLKEKDLIKLGIDICSALESCEANNIIHRDIKEGNIFVSKLGNFKLGDFGIAKETSVSGLAMTKQGTPIYMAPEVFRGEAYTKQVDIYLLGMVLYKLANHNRMPFWPPYPNEIKNVDIDKALEKRLSGAELPLPNTVSAELGNIINKACAFSAKDRYASATEFKESLMTYSKEGASEKVLFEKNPQSLPPKEEALSATTFIENVDDTGSDKWQKEILAQEELEEKSQDIESDLMKTVSLEELDELVREEKSADLPAKPLINEVKAEDPAKKPLPKIIIWVAVAAFSVMALGVGVVKLNSGDTDYVGNEEAILAFTTEDLAEDEQVEVEKIIVEEEDVEEETVEEEAIEGETIEEETIEEETIEEEILEDEIAEEVAVEKVEKEKPSTPKPAEREKPKVTQVNVSSVSVNKTELSLFVGDQETIIATVAPSNATNKQVVWHSDNPSVASVDSNGKITAMGLGVANISVSSSSNSASSSVKVEVNSQGLAFGNKTIEDAVRRQINKSSGPITPSDVNNILNLNLSNQNLTNLEGLEHLTNLRILNLSNNSISDITVLGQLGRLTRVDIKNNNVVNLSPLNRLNQLNELYISGNPYGDLSAIESIVNQLEKKDF